MYDDVELDSTVEQVIPLDEEVSFLEMQMHNNTLAEFGARSPGSLPDLVRFRAPGVGTSSEHPLIPRVSRTGRGHLGLLGEAAWSPVAQNPTASIQRRGRSYRPASDFLESEC